MGGWFEQCPKRSQSVDISSPSRPRGSQQVADVLVIGGGVAGLRAAIAASQEGADVLVLTKDTINQSNTWYAQGGIAAVLQPEDSVESHARTPSPAEPGCAMRRLSTLSSRKAPSACLNCFHGGEF